MPLCEHHSTLFGEMDINAGQSGSGCDPEVWCVPAGDFVDRGSWSAEIILTLFAYKAMFPQHVHLARGNHESRGMNKVYGFDGEVSFESCPLTQLPAHCIHLAVKLSYFDVGNLRTLTGACQHTHEAQDILEPRCAPAWTFPVIAGRPHVISHSWLHCKAKCLTATSQLTSQTPWQLLIGMGSACLQPMQLKVICKISSGHFQHLGTVSDTGLLPAQTIVILSVATCGCHT